MDEFAYGVVIPTHARRELVMQALESVWTQTLPPAEVVVVVDGDVDGTAAAIRARFPRTRVIALDGNAGAAAARNAGMAAITAPWVAFLDDDDLWHRTKQELLGRYVAAHPTCEAVRCGFWMFHEPAVEPGGAFGLVSELVGASRLELEAAADTTSPRNDISYLDIEGRSLRLMLERNRGVMSGTVVKREVLETLPAVAADLRRGQDWILFINVAAVTEWHWMRDRLVFIRLHADQITRTRGSRAPEHVTALLQEAWGRYGAREGISLVDYGPEYRGLVQGWLWGRVRAGNVRGGLAAYRGGRQLLPRRRDRAYALCPPQITYRLRRLARGRGRS